MTKKNMQNFTQDYYNKDYFVTPEGKKYKSYDGEEKGWSYANDSGEFLGCEPITRAWKQIFEQPKTMLDVGAGRGTFVSYARNQGIEAVGFDFSKWAISDKGRYYRCEKDWLKWGDVTKSWDYADKSFDLVTCLDLMEHIYESDIKQTLNEAFRVSKKFIFFQIATIPENGICFQKDQEIPMEWQGCAVAGHVTIQTKQWWISQLFKSGWRIREDLLEWFTILVGPETLANWHQNLMVVMERT